MRQNQGFTLVELLVAITVLAIVGSGMFSSYYNTRKTGRDTKRRGDIKALEQAFEQYFAIQGNYANTGCSVMGGAIRGLYPEDPVGIPDWNEYSENCTATDYYCVCAHLERPDTGNSEDGVCTFDMGGSLDWFCVESNQ